MATAHPTAAVQPIEFGDGTAELEIFLEPTCPYSKRTFEKLPALMAAVGEDKLTVRLRFVSQPWHLFSGIVTRAILAASATPGGREAALKAMTGIYKHREDFEFEDHSHGPNMDRTPGQIVAEIGKFAGVDLSEAFRLKSVDRAMRWHARYYRQNGIHESPTFAINGIVERGMSSGQTIEEWAELLRPHLHG
ncbi:thioredoxin domain-containing protein [soil metagenome]